MHFDFDSICTSFCIKKPTNCGSDFRSNFFNVVPLSMNNRIEYLVKYSVAPPPSRDYYGLKVFQDEVILYLWRISHGPHKAPFIYRSKLTEFNQEKSLQNEIRRGFGKYLLKHIRNIAEGNRNTLLTLPISLIEKILRYLEFTDIIKLSSLSHIAYEVFNTDSIWQILYTRDKETDISLEEQKKIRTVYGWKQLYKDKQMQASIKNKKNLRVLSLTNNAKTNKLLMRPISDTSKSVSNKTSTIDITAKKRSESSMADLVALPLFKTMSDIRTSTKNEKSLLPKSNVKNVRSTFNVNEKNIKRDVITLNTTIKQETETDDSKRNEISNKQINRTIKSERYSNKINNMYMKPTTSTEKGKLKSKTAFKTSVSKNIENTKSSPVLTQNLHNKTQSKIKRKAKKKVTATKSEILNTDKALIESPFLVGNGNFDLADIIEASLKNIRSPRNIFDYDFSYAQPSNKTCDILDIRNEIQNIDKLKRLKSTKSSVSNNFSNKMIRDDRILDKLSEKSKPFSEASNESVVNNNNKQLLSGGDNKPFLLSEKYIKAREELRKTLDWQRSDLSSQDRWNPCPDLSFQNKYFTSPTKVDNNKEKSFVPKHPPLKASFLKPYASNGLGLEKKKEKSYPKGIQKIK